MIVFDQVKKKYPGFELDADHFELPAGQITGLVGTNGAGKSTMFRLLLGLARADGGTIQIFNENAWNLPVSLKKKIGAVFSDSGFAGYLRGSDIPPILKAFYPSFDEKQFLKLCEQMKLPLDKEISKFSTGMQAKFKVICAISHQPEFLLLDEPTAGLDVVARRSIHALLQDYMSVPGRSVLISSHIASDLESLCDDFWMIDDGKIILHETVDDLQNSYGILHVSDEQEKKLDPAAIVARVKTAGGYDVLVSDRAYYEENYPGIQSEKGNIDDLILVMKGENGK